MHDPAEIAAIARRIEELEESQFSSAVEDALRRATMEVSSDDQAE